MRGAGRLSQDGRPAPSGSFCRVPGDDRLAGGASEMEPSQPARRSLREIGEERAERDFHFQAETWNVAGMNVESVRALLRDELQAELLALQEWPRGDPGWTLHDEGSYAGVVLQSQSMYRGVAVLYRHEVFTLLKKKEGERGLWCLFRHVKTGRKLWFGSLHMQHGVPVDEFDVCYQEYLHLLPKKPGSVVLMADFNVPFKWKHVQGEWVPAVRDAKWEALRSASMVRGLQQHAPVLPEPNQPTYIARKSGVKSSQIDGVFLDRVAGRRCGGAGG